MPALNKSILAIALMACVSTASLAQDLGGLVNDVKHATGGGHLSADDISAGLREALQQGAHKATAKVSSVDGFYGDALIKVLMPPETKKVENTLRQMGMGDQVDKLILSMNRAAEDASSKALAIFIDAIKGMSIEDGMKILRGDNDAATRYLREKTTAALTQAFEPVIKTSLDKVNATKYWSEVFNTYNKLPTTFKKVNPDLPAYVTERALNGVFVYIANEESKIRKDPGARATDLLKKVFGSN